MKPMKPMKPMEPMNGMEPWWPEELGTPANSGAQNGMRYAVFPDKRRLLIERDGQVSTYDSGDHRISGVAQADAASRTLTFSSQTGAVDLASLRKIG